MSDRRPFRKARRFSFGRQNVRRDVRDEFAFHIDMATAEAMDEGTDPSVAREEAERRFGDADRHLQRCMRIGRRRRRAHRLGEAMHNLLLDLRFSLRMFLKSPVFTAVAVATLALGIGANTAMFSVLNGVVLQPLPYEDPARLAMLWETDREAGFLRASVSPANFLDWRDQSSLFEGLTAFTSSSPTLTGVADPLRLDAGQVYEGFFDILRVEAMLGRTFVADDYAPGGDRVLILDHGFWIQRFGGDPNVVGASIDLDGVAHTVVGVLPEGFRFRDDFEIWRPLFFDFDIADSRGAHYLAVIGRLVPGVDLARARAEMDTIGRALEAAYPHTNTSAGINVISMHEELVGNARPMLLVLLGSMGMVLLIACANIANLTLARAFARDQEIALRAALGAGRVRLFRQLLTESLVLATLGGAVGLLAVSAGLDLVVAIVPDALPRVDEIRMDSVVLGFSFLVTLLSGVIFGIAPSFQHSRAHLSSSLQEGPWAGGVARNKRRLRGLLVVGEVALALMLVIGAGLLLRSFRELLRVDPGFQPSNVLTLRVRLPEATYAEDYQRIAFFDEALARIRGLPGVVSAGAVPWVPMQMSGWGFGFDVVGRPKPEPGNRPQANWRPVTTDYFRTMGIPLIRGRSFAEQDTAGSTPVIIINESLADRHFAGEDPIGQRIELGYGPPTDNPIQREIIGIVGSVRMWGLGGPAPAVNYTPYTQIAHPTMRFVVRTEGEPRAILSVVQEQIWAVDPDLAIDRTQTMEIFLSASHGERRFVTTILGSFAAVALLLAAVGVYGVVSYSVTQRTHEIGVRRALGAEASDIFWMVIGGGMGFALAGIGLGLVGSLAASRVIARLLFGVTTTDPVTFTGVAILLGATAAVACYLPARRATRLDPVAALRQE